jgi:alpha-tubulin suppressor-like RCC1 family protein
LPGYNWYYWGAEEGRGNNLGQNQQTPQEIPDDVIDISAGSRHTFLIEADGTVQAAGFIESDFGYRGHLGLGPVQKCQGDTTKLCEGTNVPLPVTTVVNAAGDLVDAPPFARVYAGVGVASDSGEMHSLLIAQNGKAYISGSNNRGQLCVGELNTEYVDLFHEVPGIDNAVQGAVGLDFTLIVTEDGKVYGCGSNDFGQIGQGPDVDLSTEPVQIKELDGVTDLSTGLSFAIFLNGDAGTIWGSGSNLYGQLCGFTGGNPVTTPQVRCHTD